MKTTLAGALALGLLVFAGSALGLGGAASFADIAGDDNAAPDITSVAVVESTSSAVTLRVAVSNYPTLEIGTWFNLYFDLDANPQNGILGAEALVRYVQDDHVSTQLFHADGNRWLFRSPTGIAGSYDAGELTLTVPRLALSGADPLGVHIISGRRQPMGAAEFIASDWAPNQGCCLNWLGTATATGTDPTSDHEAAPDITSIKVSDTANGWIRFAITTPNFKKLRADDTILAVYFNTDFRQGTGRVGADYALGHVGGTASLARWNKETRRFVDVPGSPLVRTENANNVVTLEVHRSEFRDIGRFQFRLTSAVLHMFTGLTFGVDQAPDITSTYWGYQLANKSVFRLLAGKAVGRSAPRAGAPFTISVPVQRSDTKRAIASGSVTCNVKVAGKRVRATGRVRAGTAQCALVVPRQGTTVSGTMTVSSSGKSATSRFSFRVRR